MDKRNDLFAINLYQPDMSNDQLFNVGINTENTGIKDKSVYREIPDVVEKFSNDGQFDENAFSHFYDQVLIRYNQMASDENSNNLVKNYDYDPWDWKHDGDKRNTAAMLYREKNPMMTSYGIRNLDAITSSGLSIRERAQMNRVFDTDSQTWLDYTPNNRGLFASIAGPTLVLAQYDQDEDEEINGQIIHHKKGEYKFDADGVPYYETLGNREYYGREVLQFTDTLTTDGSYWNQFDFFDSDGLTKSIGSTILKNAVMIAPTLLPGVGEIYGALTAGMALAQALPVLGKSIDGLITNDTLGNSFGRAMTDVENWAAKFQGSVSDAGRQNMWSLENTAKMISDVSLQLMQQKAIAKIPYLLSKNPYTRENVNLAKNLSYAYMSLTSAQDTYSAFKEAGASDAVAGIGMLSSMGAYWTLMSQDYFKSILFKDSWVDEDSVKGVVRNVANDMQDIIKKEVTDTKTAKGLLTRLKNSFITQIKNGPSTFTQRAISEGVEETMEEVIMDSIKGLTLGAEALGIPVGEQNLDFGFSIEDMTSRYFQSFVGGFIGGAIFEGYNKLPWIGGPSQNTEKTPEANLAELSYLIMSGRGNELRRNVEKMHRNKVFGSTTLSGTKLAIATDVDGTDKVVSSASDDSMSQNDLVYRALMDQINYIENIVTKEGFRDKYNMHRSVLQKLYRAYEDDYDRAALSTALEGVNSLVNRDMLRMVTKIERIQSKIDTLIQKLPKSGDEASDKADFEKALKNNEEYNQLVEQLKEVRKERDELFAGNRLQYYVSRALYGMNKNAVESVLGFGDKESFTRVIYNEEFANLPKVLQDEISAQYESLFSGGSDKVLEAADIYWYLSEKLTPKLNEIAKRLEGFESEGVYLNSGEKYLELLSQKEEKLKEREKLMQAEQTEDVLQKTVALNKEIASIDEDIKTINENPEYATRAWDEGVMKAILSARGNLRLLGELAQARLADYKKSIDSGKIVRDDDTLNAILNEIKKTMGRVDPKVSFGEYMMQAADEINPIKHDFPSTEINIDNEFNEYMSAFYENLGVNLDYAIANLDKAIELLKANGFSDRDINALMYGRVENEDGPLEGVAPILPRIGNMDITEFFDEIKKLKESAPRSFVMDMINDFLIATNDEGKINIFEAVNQEIRKISNKESIDDYVTDVVSDAQLSYALKVINALIGITRGSSDNLTKFANIAGENHTDKNSAIKYAELNPIISKAIVDDLTQFKRTIETLQNISAANSGSKMRIHKEMSVNMRKKFVAKLKLYVEPFKEEFKDIDLDKIISETFKDVDLDNITTDNFPEYESRFIALETAIYDAVKELNYNYDTLATKLVKVFGEKSAWRQESTRLSEKEDTIISDYDMIMYMATTISLHSNDFFVKFVNIIDEELKDKEKGRVPVYGQEYAVKLAMANILNQNLFNKIIDKIAQSYGGTDEAIKNRSRLYNTTVVFGGAGTGKTVGVAYFIKKLLEGRDDVDIAYVAMNDAQLKRLLGSVKESENSCKNMLFSALEADIFAGKINKDNLQLVAYKDESGKQSSYTKIKNTTIKSPNILDNSKKIKIMLVDEIGTRNFAELKLLSEYAAGQGITIIGLGDYKQVTHPVECTIVSENDKNGKTAKVSSSFEDCFTVKTPSLTATMRSATRGKVENYERLDSKLSRVYNKVISEGLSESDADKLITEEETRLSYFVSGDRIAGDVITTSDNYFNYLDTVLNIVKNMSDKDKKDAVCIITSDTSKYSDAKYKDCVIQNINDAQGGEYMYVFVDVAKHQDTKFDDYRFIYTATQRSQVATVVLDDSSYYRNTCKIVSEPSPSATNPYGSADQDAEFQRFKEWRRKGLEGLQPSADFENHFNAAAKINPTATTAKPIRASEPTQPTPQQQEAKHQTEKPINEKEVKSSPSEETPKERQDPDADMEAAINALKTDTGAEQKTPEITDETPKETEVSEAELETDEQEKKEAIAKKVHDGIAESRRLIDEYTGKGGQVGTSEEFYRDVVGHRNPESFIVRSKTSKATLGNAWYSIISNIRRYVLTDINSAGNRIKENADIFNTAIDEGGSKSLKSIWSSVPKVVVEVDENGWFNAVVESVDGKEIITVPIIQIKGAPQGVYTGSFDLVAKADYKKGDRISLEELVKKYPGLVVLPTGFIIVATDDNTQDFDADTIRFIEQNNGVSMIAAGMDTDTVEEDSVYQVTEVTDSSGQIRRWMYNPRKFAIMNVQRVGTIEDIFKFVIALNAKKYGKDSYENKEINLPLLGGFSWEIINQILTQYSNIDGWDSIGDPTQSDWFAKINSKLKGFTILPEVHQKVLMAQVFNYMLNSADLDSQWLTYISKFLSKSGVYRMYMQRGGAEHRISIQATDADTILTLEKKDENAVWTTTKTEHAECTLATKKLTPKPGHDITDIKKALKPLLKEFLPTGIDQETKMWVTRQGKENRGEYYDINDNLCDIVSSLLSANDGTLTTKIITDLTHILSQIPQFKYGFFLNFRSSITDPLQNGFKKFSTVGTDSFAITTDASEWTYAAYGIDPTRIHAPEVAKERRSVEIDFDTWVDEFRSSTLGALSEQQIAKIIENVKSKLDSFTSKTFESEITKYINEVNTDLRVNTFMAKTPQIVIDESGYSISYVDTFNEMCSNLISKIENQQGRYTVTRYNSDFDEHNDFIFCPETKQYYRITSNGKEGVIEFAQTAPRYFMLLQAINDLTNFSDIDINDVITLKKYAMSLWNSDTDWKIIKSAMDLLNSINETSPQSLQDIKNTIGSYLLAKLLPSSFNDLNPDYNEC